MTTPIKSQTMRIYEKEKSVLFLLAQKFTSVHAKKCSVQFVRYRPPVCFMKLPEKLLCGGNAENPWI